MSRNVFDIMTLQDVAFRDIRRGVSYIYNMHENMRNENTVQ